MSRHAAWLATLGLALLLSPALAAGVTGSTLVLRGGAGDAWLADTIAPDIEDWRRDGLGNWLLDMRVDVEGVATGGSGVIWFSQLRPDNVTSFWPFQPAVYDGNGGFDVRLTSARDPSGIAFAFLAATDAAGPDGLAGRVVINPSFPMLETIDRPAARSGQGVAVASYSHFSSALAPRSATSKGVEVEDSREGELGPFSMERRFGLRVAFDEPGLHFAQAFVRQREGFGEWRADAALGETRVANDGYLYGASVTSSGVSAGLSGYGPNAALAVRLEDEADASPATFLQAVFLRASAEDLGVSVPPLVFVGETAPVGHLGPSCIESTMGLVECAVEA